MKKSELFAIAAGIIGLTADLITLFLFFQQRASTSSSGQPPLSLSYEIVVVFTFIYGWFILAWVLIRRNWIKTEKITREEVEIIAATVIYNTPNRQVFQARATSTVAALGILLLPLSLLLPFYYQIPIENKIKWITAVLCADILSMAVVAVLIYVAISSLMPIIYTDMDNLGEL